MNNPEKLATQGIQDEDKQSKNTTQYVLDNTMRKQTHILSGRKLTIGVKLQVHVKKCFFYLKFFGIY